ncbi:dipeptide epimerase [Solilutibacter silvestris]|uniref:Dipeptide epimerase n=1 Tax=Solilutibacter silvestris TaxID=1645665 RepID=A0A2K1PZH3_9GAMM|nr:dipeptide epimerase [Lysobacter silvestris]PNS08067.1 L-alanine-DL-glutamate epimerase / enolase-related protein [Lysobacter silvestris]
MKIRTIRLGMLRIPLKTPFKTALRTVEQVEDVVVAIETDDGHVGHGSAAATAAITGDTHGSIIEAIRRYIAPQLIDGDITDLNALVARTQGALQRNTSAKAAAEIALYDLWGQLHGAPLYQLLGGGEPRLSTDITISVDGIDKMVADSLDALARGFTSLKIKVGKDMATDIERMRAVHAAVAGRASLRLDANQGWNAREAIHAIRTLEDAGVAMELVEQPVKAHDIDGLREVSANVRTPVMADESAFGPREAIELIRTRAADIINIKLMKAGGISNALKMADVAAIHGVDCMMGCMLEGPIGVTAAAHVAVARSATITRIDLDGPSLCTFNPVHGTTVFDEANIMLGDAPGLGIAKIDGIEWLNS